MTLRALKTTALLFSCALSFTTAADAATKTWAGNFPKTGNVTIPSGTTVTLDTDVALSSLTVNGELICGNRNLALSANWIMVNGLFQCGTPAAPYTKNLDIRLTGADTGADVMGMGNKFLGAMAGGKIVLQGEKRNGWTRLAATAPKGARKVTLKDAAGWRVDDRIVIVSTDFQADHAEERRIKAIAGNVVTLASPLEYEHWCKSDTYNGKTIEECAEVGLLSRNIVIHGDALSKNAGFGGHMMIMKGSSAQLDGIQLSNMGQKSKIGRYPMHWHLVGNAPGQYLTNSSIVHSYNRFVSIHGTHRIHLAGNVAFDTIGHGYYLEDGIEHDNIIENNLGALVRNATNSLPTASDRQASVFWISNPDNTVRGNVAAGSENTGFWLGFPEHPLGFSATTRIWPRRTPLKVFNNNVSHSNEARGLYVDGGENSSRETITTWYEPRENPADSSSAIVPPVFSNFTTYKNRYEGVWLRSFSKPVLQSFRFADNWMGAYFASLSGASGSIEDALVVGETGNKGNPDDWEARGVDGREIPHPWSEHDSIRGLQFYDGPMAVRDSLFVNFLSNAKRQAGGLTNLSSNPYWVSSASSVKGASFINSNKVWLDPLTPLKTGDSFLAFRDIDGSVTGVPGARIVPPNPVLYTSSCTHKKIWNAYICPHNYVGLQMYSYGGLNLAGTMLMRNDGAKYKLGTTPGSDDSLHMQLIENRRYSLDLPGTVPNRISFVRYEKKGKAVRLSLKYPTSAFKVTMWGQPVQKAFTIDGLESGGTKYFYDAAAGRLHLRLVSTDGNWQEYEINR